MLIWRSVCFCTYSPQRTPRTQRESTIPHDKDYRAYDTCLFYELAQARLQFEHQVRLPVIYNGITLQAVYRVDFIVENCLVVEIKCAEKLLPVHVAQVISYLKLGNYRLGLLINFNVPHLRQGIHRVINGPQSEL